MTIRLLIADDYVIVRQGLKQIFSLTDHIRVTGEAANGEQVMELLSKDAFDALLLDMCMPGINGMELIMRIRAGNISLPILVFSVIDSPQVARLALQAGASAYLDKSSPTEAVIAAIDKLMAKERSVVAGANENNAFVLKRKAQEEAHQSLSKRERQVLRLLVNGKRINDIAEELAISNNAVSTYKARLMQKMDFQSHAELMCYGLAHGLLE